MRLASIALAAAAAALSTIPAWAHHSHANYNTGEFTTLSGTITEVTWTNPHVWLYMEVAARRAARRCGPSRAAVPRR